MNHSSRHRAAWTALLLVVLLFASSCRKRQGAGYDFIPTSVAAPQASDSPPEITFERYLTLQKETPRLGDYTVDVEIDASLPGMKRQGQLRATRILKGATELSYRGAQFTGDDSIKTDVIARYLNAEREALQRPLNVGLTRENYSFVYRGVANYLDRRAHVFEVIPKERRLGLYRGELWLDIETGNPLREYGRFVRNPSVFLSDVDFVRDYHIVEGRSLPARLITNMETRLVGPAEITIHYFNYDLSGGTPPAGGKDSDAPSG